MSAAEICLKKVVNVVTVADLKSDFFDGVCIIGENVKSLESYSVLTDIYQLLGGYAKFNRSVNSRSQVSSVVDPTRGKLIVFSCTGASDDDFDDVRKFRSAGEAATKFVLSAGLKTPLFIVVPSVRFPNAQLLGMLGVLHALYVPLNVRRLNNNDGTHKVSQIGLHLLKDKEVYLNSPLLFVQLLGALQRGFQVCRDVGDSDPIHMTSKNVAAYVQKYFDGSSSIAVSVTENEKEIADDFPLVAAVNRGANAVEDHKARLIWLEYVNEQEPSTNLDFETLCLVGKGVTLDTGGLDIKTGGAMFGMSRDKYGSAVVAGFFAVLDALKPKGIKVRACMCMVRNSVDAASYSCDEIITARSGKRIHIQNTDAEGRIAMLDALTYFREQALKEKNPHLMTLATLTGHCVLSYGHCSAIMDNGPARALRYAENLQKTGDLCGQPVEISRLYNEDFQFHSSETEAAHLRQANAKPSVQTVRGHMTPAAFLIRGSGLDENGTNSDLPIQFTHVDIGSSMGTYPGVTFPNPLLTLVMQ